MAAQKWRNLAGAMSGEDADVPPPERVDDLKKSEEKNMEVPVNKEISRKKGFFVQEKP